MEFREQSIQLPVIAFNFEELKGAITETMRKYTGIIVTEDTLSSCKATQKELAGVRNKIDSYRKEKKKELSKPIDAFETQCKELIKLVEDAEKPIKEGIQVFDDKKRENKKQTAILIINHAIATHGLSEKYAKQLTVIDKYMNLTASAKEVKEDVEQRALMLKEQQLKEIEMLEIIQSAIDNANKGINAKLAIEDFKSLINMGMPTKGIIEEVNKRAERIRVAELPKEEIKQEPIKPVENIVKPIEVAEVAKAEEKQELYFVEIRVVGTKQQTAALGSYLRENGYKYEVLNKGVADND